MFFRIHFHSVAACLVCLAVVSCPVRAGDAPAAPRLAEVVPADTRLFLEFREVGSVSETLVSLALSRMLSGLVATTMPAAATQPFQTQPATAITSWRSVIIKAIGLDNAEASPLLLTGPVALAADGWSGLGDAVLLVAPADAVAFEAKMVDQRISVTADSRVRRYRLSRGHELACDGRIVVIGSATVPSGLYSRTVSLWENENGASLGDMAEYRERTSGLPGNSQIVFYSGISSRIPSGSSFMGRWLPSDWPQLRSVAIGAHVSANGVTIDTNARTVPEDESDHGAWALSMESLLSLPAWTLAAWSQPIDFIERFRDLERSRPAWLELLKGDLSSVSIERNLLRHLSGDSIIVIGSDQEASSSSSPGRSRLILPVLALLVETDDPYSVERIMERLTYNLLKSTGRSQKELRTVVHVSKLPGGAKVRAVDLGRLLWLETECPFLASMELSWAVFDRWLVIGTTPSAVRDIALARSGEGKTLDPDLVSDWTLGAVGNQVPVEMLLVARPRATAEMIRTWLGYIGREYPEMMHSQWWRRLRRRQDLERVQLGIYPTAQTYMQGVEVGETRPNCPAHGRLFPGDRILAVNGEPLDTDAPLRSLREKVAMREKDDRVTLRIVREGEQQDIDIPMPVEEDDGVYSHPLMLLQQSANAMDFFFSASYAVWRPQTDRLKAHLDLCFMPAGSGRE